MRMTSAQRMSTRPERDKYVVYAFAQNTIGSDLTTLVVATAQDLCGFEQHTIKLIANGDVGTP
jgi:hypothetical protein